MKNVRIDFDLDQTKSSVMAGGSDKDDLSSLSVDYAFLKLLDLGRRGQEFNLADFIFRLDFPRPFFCVGSFVKMSGRFMLYKPVSYIYRYE